MACVLVRNMSTADSLNLFLDSNTKEFKGLLPNKYTFFRTPVCKHGIAESAGF